ncbi:MAG TPA: tetratricopeptide repeat protein [Verrucomicrobiae bacterium]|jgi:tetratricopeptide (TPR) repeat protein
MENTLENPPAPRPVWDRGWIFILLIIVATVVAYAPCWWPPPGWPVPASISPSNQLGFVWDDDVLCVANPLIKSPHGWYEVWTTKKTPDYFPVMSSAFWVQWRMWGMNPSGYRIVNALLHALDAILLWRILCWLMPGQGTAAKLAAAIFALHPVNVESVAWIAELKNTLSLMFFCLSLLAYLRFDRKEDWKWYFLSFAAFLLALLSKIEVAPLPCIILGIAWWQRDRIGWDDLINTIPFFVAAFALGLVSIWFQNHVAIGHDVVRTDNFWSRLAGAGWAVWFYFYKTVLPINVMPIYPRWHIDPANVLSYLPGILLVLGFVLCWVYRAKWGKAVLFGLGYAVLMFLPALGFLNIYFFRFSLVANHWQYFSVIGPIALVSVGLVELSKLFPQDKILRPLFCGVLLLILGALTWENAGVYKNSETLWTTTLDKNPDCFIGHNDLGFVMLERGETTNALPHFRRAVELQPDDEASQKNLGSALLQEGNVDDAITQFQIALNLRTNDVGAMNNLALAYSRQGKMSDALAEYEKALAIQPDDAGVHHNYGMALFRLGRVDEAMAHYQKAMATQPNDPELHNDVANVLSKRGQDAAAIKEWEKAVSLRTNYFAAENNLAWALATDPDASLRNGTNAVQLAEDANRIAHAQNPLVLHTLAAAYAEEGQFSNAVTTAGQALEQAAVQHNVSLAAAIEAQLKFYEANQPYHVAPN